jgi:hypothetical protein
MDFRDEECQEFVNLGAPSDPDKAQFWINLEDFKTVATYGEFWYPVPNVQFLDGTTFYQLLAAWLWGFEDKEGHWPIRYDGANEPWQGYIDPKGNRSGWRAALDPQHDYVFTMPNAKTPFYDNTFYTLVRSIFVHFTQEWGPPVPVTPHSIRHMLSTYLSRLDVNPNEIESFSYVLHHSPETHNGHYVYSNNMIRIAPAVKRMEQIFRNLL